jgi:uncharacterized membrane protein YdjX (TVP38/TMEM64 family)
MDRRVVAGLVVAAVLAGALLVSPEAVLPRLAWLTGDPIRFGAALVGLALVRPLLAWPTTLLAVAAGYGLGEWALPAALALMTLTSLPPYLLARRGRAAAGWVADAGERVVSVAGDFRSVTASRLFPTPSDVVSIGAGLAGVPPRVYVIGTTVGEFPWAFAGVVAGGKAGTPASGEAALGDVVGPWVAVAAALVGTLLLARPAYRALRE